MFNFLRDLFRTKPKIELPKYEPYSHQFESTSNTTIVMTNQNLDEIKVLNPKPVKKEVSKKTRLSKAKSVAKPLTVKKTTARKTTRVEDNSMDIMTAVVSASLFDSSPSYASDNSSSSDYSGGDFGGGSDSSWD